MLPSENGRAVQVILILFAAVFTCLVSLAAGKLAFAVLKFRLSPRESLFLRFILGSSILSLLVFLLAAVRLAYTSVFLILGAAILASAAALRGRTKPARSTAVPAIWKVTLGMIYAAFGVLYLFNALPPETSSDGTAYHVALPARYLRDHGFSQFIPTLYTTLSQGLEMLFLFAFAFGRHSAAAMVHFAYLLLIPLGLWLIGDRRRMPCEALIAGILVFVSPIVGRTGTIAYVDVALAAVAIALFYLVEVWIDELRTGLIVAAGLLAGFCYSIKYTGITALAYVLAMIVWYQRGQPRRMARDAAIVSGCAFLVMAPWLLKNLITTTNPIAPFGNRLFPNPYFYPAAEDSLSVAMRDYGGVSYAEVPLELTIRGARLQGHLGPVFLLAPIALAALRNPLGRRLLIAALCMGAIYPLNIGTRFVIPALPFVALAMAIPLARAPYLGLAVVVLHAILSWPSMNTLYCDVGGWRLQGIPWRAALRITPEVDYIRRQQIDYDIGLSIEQNVPSSQFVFSYPTIQQSYHSRQVIVHYQSALGNRIRDALAAAMYDHLMPTRRYDIRTLPLRARRLRIVQTAGARTPYDFWSISEATILHQDVPVAERALVHASVNRWDAQLAIDGNPSTRWSTWQPRKQGMFFEIEFPQLVAFDRVTLDSPQGEPPANLRLEIIDDNGWILPVFGQVSIYTTPKDPSLPAAADRALKDYNVHWIVTHAADRETAEFDKDPLKWGVQSVTSLNGYTLYRVK
jgi:hypothetical protein